MGSRLKIDDLWARVNVVRMASYANFFEIKRYSDFYFENLLTNFLSLVQYPVNFVITDENLEVVFHFCLDKEHRKGFTENISMDKEINLFIKDNIFDLFPSILDKKYNISIYYMDTKVINKNNKSPWRIIKNTGFDNCKLDEYIIKDKYDYISICANLFFVDKWSMFEVETKDYMRDCIVNSMKKIENFYRNHQYNYHKKEDIVDWPNRKGPSSWRDTVNELLSNYITDNYNSFNLSGCTPGYLFSMNLPDKKDNNVFVSNILLSYRSYSRKLDYENTDNYKKFYTRYYKEDSGGYDYDIQFVSPFHSVGENKNHYCHNKKDGGYFKFFEKLCNNKKLIKKSKMSYSDILDHEYNIDLSSKMESNFHGLKNLHKIIDEELWSMIEAGEDGILKILDILSSPVGDFARSMTDPVFSTGLIHFNNIFQFGGIDRIHVDKIYNMNLSELKSINDIDDSIRNDLIRIAIVYYIFCFSVVEVNNKNMKFNPKNIQAILVPIKLRGSVWAVSVHAFYSDMSNDEIYKNNKYWIMRYIIMNSGRIKTRSKVDSILWGQAQKRVSELLKNNIGYMNDKGELSNNIYEKFESAIREVNIKLSGERRAIPYSLPQFEINSSEPNDGREFFNYRVGRGGDEEYKYIYISWKILENNLFDPIQKWEGGWSRSFYSSVELGVNSGFQIFRSELKAIKAMIEPGKSKNVH